jgi:cyclopropane-fatty-acyl-phospholipid synthase
VRSRTDLPVLGEQTNAMPNTTKIAAAEVPPIPSPRIAELAADLLTRLFGNLDCVVRLRLWNGRLLTLGKSDKLTSIKEPPPYILVCRSPAAVCAMAFGRDPLRLAEVYFRDDVDIEGDFFAALGLKDHLRVIRMPW